MLEFPKLKTGVSAQYGLWSEVRAKTRVMEFIDGSEQRYRVTKPRRRWVVRLEQLDEGEAARVEEFARRHFETLESFRFTDPVSGSVHDGCVLEGTSREVEARSRENCGLKLVVAEGVE